MAHGIDPARIRGRVHPLTGIAVVLSLFVASVAEAFHSPEDEAESAAECSVCQLAQTPGHASKSYAPALTGPNLFHTPTIAEPGPAPAALHISPHRSRAPPLAVSL